MIDYDDRIVLDGPADAPVRKPGDFARHPKTTAPYVRSLTKTRKRKGNKPELLEAARAAGHDVTDKTTVNELHDLLGREPSMEMYGRPSGFGDALDNSYNLVKWKERQLLIGASLVGLPYGAPDNASDFDKDELDKLAARCHEAAGSHLAAERGTWVHDLTEWLDSDRTHSDPEGGAA